MMANLHLLAKDMKPEPKDIRDMMKARGVGLIDAHVLCQNDMLHTELVRLRYNTDGSMDTMERLEGLLDLLIGSVEL